MEKGSQMKKKNYSVLRQLGHLRWRETKAKRCKEGKTTGSGEAGTKETKLVWDRKRTDEVKRQKDSELPTDKTLQEEANERLMQAIKKKNFNEAVVAQGLLEVATEEDGKCNGPIESRQWSKRELN